jgi:hypothetical protein
MIEPKLIIALALIPLVSGYLVDPPTTAPNDTISDCSYWAVATASDTCQSIADQNSLTLTQLYQYVSS